MSQVSSVRSQDFQKIWKFSEHLKFSKNLKIVIKNCHHELSSWIVITNCHHELSSRIVITNCHHELSSCKVIMTINKISDQSDGVMRRHDLRLDNWNTDYISDNWEQQYITITLWPLNKEWRGQHSQFLRCLWEREEWGESFLLQSISRHSLSKYGRLLCWLVVEDE